MKRIAPAVKRKLAEQKADSSRPIIVDTEKKEEEGEREKGVVWII